MKLIDFVAVMKSTDKLKEFLSTDSNLENVDELIIYLKNELALNSEVSLFTEAETDDDLIFTKNQVKYVQLFPLDFAIDLVQEGLGLDISSISDDEIAQKLLEYRQNDA